MALLKLTVIILQTALSVEKQICSQLPGTSVISPTVFTFSSREAISWEMENDVQP